MSFAYKVEELLALRDSVSESAVSIDKFADEDVIKEHVLRPSASASANLTSRSSGRSLRPPPVVQPLAATAPQKKPSPSPSIKRGKAEKLLKEHGSPPGLRVTAGGRIVPSDLAPLGTSRFPENAFKPPTLRVAPGNIMPTQTLSNSNSAARIEIVGGQPVIFLGDRMFALPAVAPNSSTTVGSGEMMDPAAKQVPDAVTMNTHGNLSGLPSGPPRTSSTSPFAGLDLATLKAQQTLKKQELRQVEQTEVLQASHQTEVWRTGMIEKKRCLIVELDALRKSIAALENDGGSTAQSNAFLGPIGTIPGPTPTSSFGPQLQQPAPLPMYGFPAANPYGPLMMYPPPYGAFPGFPATESQPTPFVAPPANQPHSPGAASRRSHAVAIKPPQEGTTKQTLNPKSPTYEPTAKPQSSRNDAPPTPSPPKRSPWRTQGGQQSDSFQPQTLSQKPSLSSIDTTDFFPTNTHEHSSTRLAPNADELKQPSNENSIIPSTPEKHWPASPWNEPTSSRSRVNEPKSKLTSWPETLGKQTSSSSLRQRMLGQSTTVLLERAPAIGAYPPHSASSNNNLLPQSGVDRRSGTEENWPFSRKAVTHVPSTYQEGYQAGYDHVGMPDNPEVLQGYIEGLLHFLSDESKKGRLEASVRGVYTRGAESHTPSLRGLVAGSMPHDSAISMSFNRNNALAGNYENLRSSKESLTANFRRDSAYSPQGSVKDVSASYALFSEAAYAPRQRNVSNTQCPAPETHHSDRLVASRQLTSNSGGNEMGKSNQDKAIAPRVEPPLSNGNSRQFSGAQLQNRAYGTPLSNQRFYPTPKEMSPNGLRGEAVPTMRPFADHRLSGLDGAMDDLADLVIDTCVDDKTTTAGARANQAPKPIEVDVEEETASCFKPSGSKGKQKATGSPVKTPGMERNINISSPNPPSSPKKSGENSPTKAKLEHVTNKFRRGRKDDPRTMSPEEKTRHSARWRQRFQVLKKTEQEEIEEHRRNTRN